MFRKKSLSDELLVRKFRILPVFFNFFTCFEFDFWAPTAAVRGRSPTLDVCVASSIAAAARGDAAQEASDRKLSHYRNEIGELRQQNIHCRPLVGTADGRPHPAVQRSSTRQTSPTKSKSLSCAGGQPRPAQFSRILQHGQSGSSQASSTELCTTGDMSPLLSVGLATTTSTTSRLTQQYLTMTMTLSPYQAARMNLCSHQVSNFPVYPRARGCFRPAMAHATSRTHSASGRYPLRQSPPRKQF